VSRATPSGWRGCVVPMYVIDGLRIDGWAVLVKVRCCRRQQPFLHHDDDAKASKT